MKNYIIICNTENENIAVQAKILALGGKWVSGKTTIQFTDKPELIFDNLDSKERTISYHETVMRDDYKRLSCYKNHKTITAIEFLQMGKI
jgi:anthranilate/para-aminobenzoate synthase component II